MAPRRAKVNKLDNKKLSGNDVICPICRSILIKPITLPCSHGFCSSCFETSTQNANVVCPLCRVRVGSWLRSATKSKKLINETLWQTIQELFPLQVKSKLNRSGENSEDKYNGKELNDRKSNDSKRSEDKISHLETRSCQKNNKLDGIKLHNKQTKSVISVTSTSKETVKSGSAVNPVSKSQTLGAVKNLRRPNFINNFATKEYTCRILCQNVGSKDTQKNILKDSQVLKKNKRIQEINSEISNDRSNSIESECLYFKPIDYRRNPPSKGLTPIKVPTRKPNVSPHMKILAPSGQNQITINHLESAFARLCSAEEIERCKKENIEAQPQDNSAISLKRKQERCDKGTKKLKSSHKVSRMKSPANIDKRSCKSDFNLSTPNTVKRTDFKEANLISENIKRALQEQADFELATKLQQTYNQSSKYSTRSSVLKRMATKNQVKMEGIMTPYKVK